jgi:uncharacterized protein (TIGR03000 family)
MIRRLAPNVGGSALALATLILGPVPGAIAQYAIRGGPIYAGPIGGGPTGPTLFVGAYAPSFYPGALPSAYSSFPGPGAGAGLMPNYSSSYPYFGGGSTVIVPTFVPYAQPVYVGNAVLYSPRPARLTPESPEARPGQPLEGSRSASEAVTQPVIGAAYFTVRVPADAQIWVDNFLSKQTGPVREFHSPATLETGKTYEYTFRAQWREKGQTITRDRAVRFGVGSDVNVDFTQELPRKDGAVIQPPPAS